MPMTIDQRVAAFRKSLIAKQNRPKPTEIDRASRANEQLEKTELALAKTDKRRIQLLIKAASLAVAREDYAAVHAYSAEITTLCRSRVLGFQEAHPILSTLPPAPALPHLLETHTMHSPEEP